MYTKNNTIISNKNELSNYIDGKDIYNSSLLVYMNDPRITRTDYLITTYEYRPDLISKEFYGSSDYEGLLILQSGIGLENYKRGTTLQLIPKTILDNILNNI